MLVAEILNKLKQHRLPLLSEKELQVEIFKLLPIGSVREYRLDDKNILDFMVHGVAIEVKVKGNAKAIYKQIKRYAEFPNVESIILVTNRSIGFPEEINGKPCYVFKLGMGWL